jgi:NTE family protein
MLAALTHAGIRPDLLVGTSAGAVNAVAYAADPTDRGISRLAEGWRRSKRSRVFPLWSSSLVLRAIGHRDHLLPNRGLATLIEEFVDAEQLEACVIPAHVVATDLIGGAPVVLSQGPVLPALLASTAIPGLFPPVNVGGRLLVDGGNACPTPTLEAESLGATTIYVLPSFGTSPDVRPRRTMSRLYGIGQLFRHSVGSTTAATRHSVVHLIPAPTTEAVSPYNFSRSAHLIDEAAALTRAWLADRDTTATSQPSRTS